MIKYIYKAIKKVFKSKEKKAYLNTRKARVIAIYHTFNFSRKHLTTIYAELGEEELNALLYEIAYKAHITEEASIIDEAVLNYKNYIKGFYGTAN